VAVLGWEAGEGEESEEEKEKIDAETLRRRAASRGATRGETPVGNSAVGAAGIGRENLH
jgi:hypothetical protein